MAMCAHDFTFGFDRSVASSVELNAILINRETIFQYIIAVIYRRLVFLLLLRLSRLSLRVFSSLQHFTRKQGCCEGYPRSVSSNDIEIALCIIVVGFLHLSSKKSGVR
jgi:hypothetical protein